MLFADSLHDRKYVYFSYHERSIVSNIERIRDRIEEAGAGAVFVPADFNDIADQPAVHNILSRLVRDGTLRRAMRGVYAKPRHSELLGEEIPPAVDDVARAIARGNGWIVVPSGNHALNMLGLDTQVPARFSYVSSGPYKRYVVDGAEVSFSHRANRDILDKSYLTCLVVQALKALGKDGVDDGVVERLASRLTAEDAERLCAETRNATSWVFEAANRVREAKAG